MAQLVDMGSGRLWACTLIMTLLGAPSGAWASGVAPSSAGVSPPSAAIAVMGQAALTRVSPAPMRPQRIVSVNLCSDQLVLALADRNQIAGLTRNARDPDMSAGAVQAQSVRLLRGSGEEIMAIRPDLVIGAPIGRSSAVRFLKHGTYRPLDLKSTTNYAEIITSIREVSGAVGHPVRGEALIAQMNRELANLPKSRKPVVAAYYQRRGFMTGTGTLIDDMMTRVGMTNLAAKLGKPVLSHMSLEEIVAARPDYLIVESDAERVVDQGTAMLQHPALRSIPRISLPQSWTVCGGPAYVKAVKMLSDRIVADERRRRSSIR